MNSFIHTPLMVRKSVLKVIDTLARSEEPGFLSISKISNVVHLGIKGVSLNIFKADGKEQCDIDLPAEYIVSVPIDSIRKYLATSEDPDDHMVQLGDISFMPRLKMKEKAVKKQHRQVQVEQMV
jgi:hypothetical protein